MKRKIISLLLSLSILSSTTSFAASTSRYATPNSTNTHTNYDNADEFEAIEHYINELTKLDLEKNSKSETNNLFSRSKTMDSIMFNYNSKYESKKAEIISNLKKENVNIIEVDDINRSQDLLIAKKSGYDSKLFKNNQNYRIIEKEITYHPAGNANSVGYRSLPSSTSETIYNGYRMKISYITNTDAPGGDFFDTMQTDLTTPKLSTQDLLKTTFSVALGFTKWYIWVPYTYLDLAISSYSDLPSSAGGEAYTTLCNITYTKKYVHVFDKDHQYGDTAHWRLRAVANKVYVKKRDSHSFYNIKTGKGDLGDHVVTFFAYSDTYKNLTYTAYKNYVNNSSIIADYLGDFTIKSKSDNKAFSKAQGWDYYDQYMESIRDF